jgi:SAM-dependent methyltransferase
MLLAKHGLNIVGLDLSIEALVLAKYMFTLQKLPGFFVCGDILNPPFRSGSFSLAFAGGSIEHFENTQQGVKAISESLSQDGLFIATVPYMSLSTLLQGLFTGNVPDIPVLRSFFKFLYLGLMNKRHCVYGYEKSFSQMAISKYFRIADFCDIEIGPYETDYTLKFFKNQWQRKIVSHLIQLRPFWPMIYIKGKRV